MLFSTMCSAINVDPVAVSSETALFVIEHSLFGKTNLPNNQWLESYKDAFEGTAPGLLFRQPIRKGDYRSSVRAHF